MQRVAAALLACACSLATALETTGQTIHGTILSGDSREPVPSAELALVDSASTAIAAAVSSSSGAFRMAAPTPGSYSIRAFALGYDTLVTEAIEVRAGEDVEVRILLSVRPVALSGLEVVARSRPLMEHGFLHDFHYRRERGLGGHFIPREMIEERNATALTHLLGSVPGVRLLPIPSRASVSGAPMAWYGISFRGGRAGLTAQCTQQDMRAWKCLDGMRCIVQVYVDGVKAAAPMEMVNTIPPHQIEGVEVYSGAASMPPEFGGSDAACGVIVIWTRRGRG